MLNVTKENIIKLKNMGIDLYNMKLTKNIALENKMYDLIVYINSNPYDYLDFVNRINNKRAP